MLSNGVYRVETVMKGFVLFTPFQDFQNKTGGEKNTGMALRSFLRQAAEVINMMLYLPAKPKPLLEVKLYLIYT